VRRVQALIRTLFRATHTGSGNIWKRMESWSVLRNRTWPQVRHTWPFFLFFAGPALSWAFAVLAGQWLNRGVADQVRYFGTWLQLFGILLVAQGARELRREFNRPTVFAAMCARFNAIVQSFRSSDRTAAITGVVGIAMSGSAVAGYGRVRGTTEQRLDGLERELDALRNDLQDRERKIKEQLSTVRRELLEEKQERSQAHDTINRKLDHLAVGGLHLDVIGLWWLLFATIATSVPDGLASLLHSVSRYIP